MNIKWERIEHLILQLHIPFLFSDFAVFPVPVFDAAPSHIITAFFSKAACQYVMQEGAR